MNIKEMLDLADFMDTLPEEKFSMDYWVRTNYKCHNKTVGINNFETCGTSCCIAGWQALRRGYKTIRESGFWGDMRREEATKHPLLYNTIGKLFGFPQSYIKDIARENLGLTLDESVALFYDMKIKTPKQAAEKIRAMVEMENLKKAQQNA